MSTTGVVTSVTPTYRGDTLAADTTTTDLLLLVEDAGDFAEEDDFTTGDQWLVVGDSGPMQYVATDMDADTITLANPIGTAYEAGMPVRLWDPTVPPAGAPVVEYVAYVRLSDDSGVPPALLPHELVPLAGVDTLVGALVEIVEAEPQRWEVLDVLGREPVIDGSTIDPETIPDPTIPKAPPATSPDVTVTGVSNGLVLTADNVDPGTLIEYHVTDTPPVDAEDNALPFTPTVDTLVGAPTRSTVVVVTQLPVDGSALVRDVDYYVRTVARNDLGAAPPSAMESGQLNLDAVSELVSAEIRAGYVLAGSIRVGQITIDPDTGITIPTADGQTHLPSDGSAAKFTGEIETERITVGDNLTINGESNAINGELYLTNVVEAPRNAPDVSYFWEQSVGIDADTWGLTESTDGTAWATLHYYNYHLRLFDKATGNRTLDKAMPEGFYARGVVRIAHRYYVAAENGWDNLNLYLIKLDSAGDKVGIDWKVVNGGSVPKQPAVGLNQVGNLLVAWMRPSDNALIVRTYDESDGRQLNSETFNLADSYFNEPRDLTAIHKRFTGPNGELEVWLGVNGSVVRWTHADGSNPTPTWLYRPDRVKGLHFDGTRWWSAGWDSYRIYRWNTTRWSTSRTAPSGAAGYRKFAYSWFDADPGGTGTHETLTGPETNPYIPDYAWAAVSMPSPADTGDPDAPDSVRLYAEDVRQPDLGEGVTEATYASLTTIGDAPPTTNSFDNATANPGSIRSAAVDTTTLDPLIDLQGDGSGRVGPLAFTTGAKIAHDTGPIAVSAPFTGTVRLVAIGQVVLYFFDVSRPDGFDVGFRQIAQVTDPLFYPTVHVLDGRSIYNSSVYYRFRITPAGAIEMQMTGADTRVMATSGVYFTAPPPIA